MPKLDDKTSISLRRRADQCDPRSQRSSLLQRWNGNVVVCKLFTHHSYLLLLLLVFVCVCCSNLVYKSVDHNLHTSIESLHYSFLLQLASCIRYMSMMFPYATIDEVNRVDVSIVMHLLT